MIEVASLLARLQFQVQGAQDAVRASQQVEESLNSVGEAATAQTQKVQALAAANDLLTRSLESTDAKVQAEANSLRVAIAEYEAYTKAKTDGLNVTQAQGRPLESILDDEAAKLKRNKAEVDRLTESIEFYLALDSNRTTDDFVPGRGFERQLSEFEGQRDRLLNVVDAQEKSVGRLRNSLKALGETGGEERRLGRVQTAMARLSRSTGQVAGAATSARRPVSSLRLTFEQMGQVVRQLASGRFSLSSLSSLLGRLVAAAAPLVAVLSPVLVAFGLFRSRIGQLGNQIASTRPEIVGLASDLRGLGRTDLSGFLGQLETAANRGASFGFDGEEFARQVAIAARGLEGLNATPNDSAQVFQQVQRAVESADFSGLRDLDLGVNVEDVNRQLQEVREQYGLAAAQAEALGIAQEVANNRAAESGRRLVAEQSTLNGVVANMRDAWDDAVQGNEDFQNSMQRLGDTANEIIDSLRPAIEGLINGFAVLANGVSNVWDGLVLLINQDLINIAQVWRGVAGFLNNFAGVDIDIEGIDEFIAAREASLATAQAVEGLTQAWVRAKPIQDQVAIALTHIATASELTTDATERIQRATNASNLDIRDSIGTILDQASALGLTQTQIDNLSREWGIWNDRVQETVGELPAVERSLNDIEQAAQNFVSQAQGGSGVVNALADIGEASIALREDASAANALQFFNAYSAGIAEALDGGAEKIAAFREFVETQLRVQLSDEEYKALISVVEQTEAAMAPLAAEAENLKNRAATAGDTAATTADQIGGLDSQARNAATGVGALTSALEQMSGTYPVDIVISQTGTTSISVPSSLAPTPSRPVSLGATSGPDTASIQATQAAQAAFRSAERAAAAAEADTSQATAESARFASERARAEEVAEGTTRGEAEDLARLLGRGSTSGGGGGGGATDDLLNVEEIRAFLQEVNRAINIASREGVRIGTAGNAIPFEEGSFLNAEGGNLTVDTILIRGVWDFADPASKRQIIKELQEALTALQAEV